MGKQAKGVAGAQAIVARGLGVCYVCGVAEATVAQSRTSATGTSEIRLCTDCASDSDVLLLNNGVKRRVREAREMDTREQTVLVHEYRRRPPYRRPHQQYRTSTKQASLSWHDLLAEVQRIATTMRERALEPLRVTRGEKGGAP